MPLKERIGKLHFIKIKNFSYAKDIVRRMKRQAIDEEKIFAKDVSEKGLLPKIYKQFLKLNNKKINMI